jgi:hypothetical protein
MKKTIILCALFALPFISKAQTNPNEQKYSVVLSLQEWDKVMNILNQSAAPFNVVDPTKNNILTQLQVQYATLNRPKDSTKAVTDSTKVKPKKK